QILRDAEPELGHVDHGDGGRAECARSLGGEDTDRAGPGNENMVSRLQRRPLARPDPDRERFAHRSLFEAHRVGDLEEVALIDDELLQQRAIVRRSREEDEVCAEMIATGEAVLAVAARRAWLNR